MSNYAAIGNGLFIRVGSRKPRRILTVTYPKPGMQSFGSGPAVFNWARKVGAGACSVFVREGFQYKRMTISPTTIDSYEGRWV